MTEMVAYFYSDGDLVMLFAKLIVWMLLIMNVSLIFGVIRGLSV